MNTLNGYAKSTLTNDYLLTAAGGHKSILDFLSSSGGTLSLSNVDSFTIKKTSNSYSVIKFTGLINNVDTALGYLGFKNVNNPVFRDTSGTNYTLYHTGNLSPMTTSHAANGITSTDIINWNSVYTWLTTTTADTDTTINKWKELEAFLNSITESDTLTGLLAGRVAKSGDTMTGALNVPSLTVTGAASFSQAINANILGNSATASRLENPRTISLTGSVTGSGSFDGSGNLSIATTTNHNFDGRYIRWGGSASDVTAMAWGTLTTANGYTILSHTSSSDGGDWGMVNKDGQIFMQLDGYYYQREGLYRVADTYDLAGYLSLTGGTISSSTTSCPLIIKSTASSNIGSYLDFVAGTTTIARVGCYDGYAFFKNEAGNHELRIYQNGSITYENNTVWHAGNDGSDSTLDADLLDGLHGSYYAAASSLGNYVTLSTAQTISGNKTFSSVTIDNLTAGNLVVSGGASFALIINGSISGNSDTVDNEHASAFAHRQTPNNLVHNGNEVTMIPDSYNNSLWFNYESVSRNSTSTITEYIFGDGHHGVSPISAGRGTFSDPNWGQQIIINRAITGGDAVITYRVNGSDVGYMGFTSGGNPVIYNPNTNPYTIWHSGNCDIDLAKRLYYGMVIESVMYVENDTHWACLGYFTAPSSTGYSYDHIVMSLTSEFWGNQHNSSDIIDIAFDNSSGNYDIILTAVRICISGSDRQYKYKIDNTTRRIYIYGYYTGGNSYGNTYLSLLNSRYDCWTTVGTVNQTVPSDAVTISWASPSIGGLDVNGALRVRGTDVYLGNDSLTVWLSSNINRAIYGVDADTSVSAYKRMCAYAMLPDNDADDGWLVRPAGGTFNDAYLTILQGGNVGIGTTSPRSKLDVKQGTVTIAGNSTGSSGITSDLDAMIIGPYTTRNATSGYYYPGIAFNHMLGYGNDVSYDHSPQGWIGLRLYDTPGSERSYLVFATKEDTASILTRPVERMCIDPLGNVGIGTTSPTLKLDVNGWVKGTGIFSTGYYYLPCSTDVNSNGVLAVIDNGGNHPIFGYGFALYGCDVTLTGYNLHLVSGATWNDHTNGIEILANGNVGIGTVSPAYKLDVNGSFRVTGSSTLSDTTLSNLVVTGGASFALTINGSINGSATQLLNSRSLWGNSFNGTADIDDSITLANNKCVYIKNSSSLSKNVLQLTNSDILKVGYGSGIAGHNTEISGGTIYLKTNTTNTTALTLDSNLHSIFGGNIILKNDSIISFKDTSNTNRNALTLSTSNNLAIGFGTSGAGYNTYLDGNNIYMRVGTSHTTALTVDTDGLFTFKASLYTEASTLAETSADLNLNNSNIKGVNGIYFADISNEINEGIHFVRSGNNVDTLTSYEGTLYYRTNRALGTTKSNAPTLSSNIILHNKNISNYQRYHNIYYTTSSNGTAGTTTIAATLNSSTYKGYVNGYWLGGLDYAGAMCTSDMSNASNTHKYDFVKTGDADTFIYDSSTTVQLIIGSRGTNEIIDIYNLQGATLRIFVVNSYDDTRCSVYVIDGDTRTTDSSGDYSTSIAGNVKYWKYGSGSYTQLTGISTYFLSNTRGILRVIWESEGRIFLIKCSAFPN